MKNTDDTTHFDPDFFSESDCRRVGIRMSWVGNFLKINCRGDLYSGLESKESGVSHPWLFTLESGIDVPPGN